jgi:hypothetical protein
MDCSLVGTLFGSPINIEEAAAACVADCTGGEGGEEVGVAGGTASSGASFNPLTEDMPLT